MAQLVAATAADLELAGGASSQLIRDPVSGNGPLSACRCFSHGSDRAGAHEREASACVTSHLKGSPSISPVTASAKRRRTQSPVWPASSRTA